MCQGQLIFWVDRILQRYITEFVVDTITSYSKVERNFFQGPRSRYLLSLKTWIKMLICEKGIMQMEQDCIEIEWLCISINIK